MAIYHLRASMISRSQGRSATAAIAYRVAERIEDRRTGLVVVTIPAGAAPYEIHVVPGQFALFWTQPNNTAIRYTVGIGRPGLYEAGEFYVGAKKEWPSWTPTPGMLRREPQKYGPLRNGMPGGLSNPLGARALYLFQPGRGDTFLRVHGTNDPTTIGRAVSNGCARLVNNQIIQLFNQVPLDTRVVLYPNGAT
jgi:lipoprotein-anchoring transpeptidase ErfK/SrfK|tara:strand:+ start:41 stop:622 length:582 start_codon:yes stop_codon:yes gene_type:complete